MQNISHKIVGNKLTIEVDISPQTIAAARPSKSGATLLVASTGGFQPATRVKDRAIKFALNVTVEP